MKADFESHLRMLDAGQRHPRPPAASAGNTVILHNNQVSSHTATSLRGLMPSTLSQPQ